MIKGHALILPLALIISGCVVKDTVQTLNGHNRRMAARERFSLQESKLKDDAKSAMGCVLAYAISRAEANSTSLDIYVAALDACQNEVSVFDHQAGLTAREKVRGRLTHLSVTEATKQIREEFYSQLRPSTVRAIVEARQTPEPKQAPAKAEPGSI